MAPKSQGLNPSRASYLEACWPVNQVEIQVVQLQVAECLLAGSFHYALVVERAPQLADNEEMLALHHLLLELLLEGHSHLFLILVHLGTVNVAVPKVNGNLHSLGHLARRGLERKEYKP